MEALQDKVATLASAHAEQATATAAVRKTVAGSADARRAQQVANDALKTLADSVQAHRIHSDVVQSYAGGIRLDAIFVDEGFGTLDPQALDFAIKALQDLQQSGRLVGIISHVAELKEWIDARLELKATQAGSIAEFQL